MSRMSYFHTIMFDPNISVDICDPRQAKSIKLACRDENLNKVAIELSIENALELAEDMLRHINREERWKDEIK